MGLKWQRWGRQRPIHTSTRIRPWAELANSQKYRNSAAYLEHALFLYPPSRSSAHERDRCLAEAWLAVLACSPGSGPPPASGAGVLNPPTHPPRLRGWGCCMYLQGDAGGLPALICTYSRTHNPTRMDFCKAHLFSVFCNPFCSEHLPKRVSQSIQNLKKWCRHPFKK